MSSSEGVVLDVFGVSVHLEGPPEIVEAIAEHLPSSAAENQESQGASLHYRIIPKSHGATLLGHEVSRPDGSTLGNFRQKDTAVQAVGSEIHFEIACLSSWVFVHAGVVAVDGKAAVLPGRSLAGKSTLVAALLKAGATYYSDEYAVFGDGALVHAYDRPLRCRNADGTATFVHPETVTDKVGGDPAAVALVAAIEYQPGEQWDVSTMPPATAALRVVDNTVRAREFPGPTTKVAALLGATQSIVGVRGEADEAASEIIELLQASSS